MKILSVRHIQGTDVCIIVADVSGDAVVVYCWYSALTNWNNTGIAATQAQALAFVRQRVLEAMGLDIAIMNLTDLGISG